MKKKKIIILSVLGLIILIIGIILLVTNNIIIKNKSKLTIIDAKTQEKFYEDNKYTYYYPCVKSNSMYVKFENGNKMLISDALESKKVTIDELLNAGLEVIKEKK